MIWMLLVLRERSTSWTTWKQVDATLIFYTESQCLDIWSRIVLSKVDQGLPKSGAWRGEVQRPDSESKAPVAAGASTQTGTGAYGNTGGDVEYGAINTDGDNDGVPAVGVGRSSTEGEAMDNVRGAASIGASNH